MTICRDTSERTICVFFAVFQKAITFVLNRVVQFIENKTTMNKNKSRYQSLPTAHFESRGFLSCSFELIEKRIVISILFFSVYSKDLELLLVLNNFRSRYSILSLTVRTLQHAPQNSFATSKTVLIMCLIHCKQTRN